VTLSLDTEPACPGARVTTAKAFEGARGEKLLAIRCRFDSIPAATWDRLAIANPWATPFSRWAFHRAWWDAYAANAHDETLVVVAGDRPNGEPVAIVPLMHRHEVEPEDAQTRTRIRHAGGAPLTPVAPTAKAVFMGASYHADYATILGAEGILRPVSEAVVAKFADSVRAGPDPHHAAPWDVVDLRRLRCGDPAADALAASFGRREMSAGWTLNVEREDVCPVVHLPEGGSFDAYLATLTKKNRHEVRRKIRRAEAAGELRFEDSRDPLAELELFIDLHQRRWGELGLFPNTPGGAQSRLFVRRVFELFGPDGPFRLSFLSVGGRRIAGALWLEDGQAIYYYNAGIDPAARELSPGVLLVAMLTKRALELGRMRFDILRGDEPYKYVWGGVDEPIQRILVRRTVEQ
jgi:CelD/BcsL family acetyltransferase involved in cellulose biosynthesis